MASQLQLDWARTHTRVCTRFPHHHRYRLVISAPRTKCSQSLGVTFTLQHSSRLSVTFRGRKVIFPSPRAEHNRLKIEQRVISVLFSSVAGIRLQTQSTGFTSSVGLGRVPRAPHRATSGPESFMKTEVTRSSYGSVTRAWLLPKPL